MSRTILFCVLGALVWAALGLASMVSATGGHLSMPLDDAFIFFQYAKRAAAGAPFTYQEGGEISTGATSPLTVALHTLGHLLGFRGAWAALYAVLTGAALLAWSAVSAARIGRRLTPTAPWVPPALLLTSGPLGWGFLSGMDVALIVSLGLAVVASWPAPGSPPSGRTTTGLALLGLTRPEGLVLTVLASLLGSLGRRSARWAIPVGVALLPLLATWILTGSPRNASFEVKSILGDPGLSFGDLVLTAASHFQEAVKGILGGGIVADTTRVTANDGSAAGHYVVPFALGLALLGLLPEAWSEGRERRPRESLVLATWIAALLVIVSVAVPRNWHWHRYWMPLYPWILIGAGAGVARVGDWIDTAREARFRGDATRALASALVLLSLPGAAFFVVAYGRNCADIHFQHIELAGRLERGDPVRPRLLGLHDAGALAYFTSIPVLDLEGLVSEAFRKPARLGAAGVWETLETLPPERRPDVLALYPNWFSPDFLRPHRAIHDQRLFRPSIVAGNPLQLYRADWSGAGSGDIPRNPRIREALNGLTLRAEIDVADLSSEKASGYGIEVLDGATRGILQTLETEGGETVLDGGRLVSGGERFRLAGLTPGRPVVLVTRTHAPFRVVVEVDGDPVGMWGEGGPEAGRWSESGYRIPAERIRGSEVRIVIRSGDPHHTAYGSFHYWAYQPGHGSP